MKAPASVPPPIPQAAPRGGAPAGGGSPGEASNGKASAQAHLRAAGEDLQRLLALQWELGKAEARQIARAAALAVAFAVGGVILTVAALVLLASGVVGYALGVPWSHLVGTGGTALVLGLTLTGWGAYRLKNLPWPVETRRSVEETLSWLGAQLRFRLRFG
ncbi:MAG TPA: phage holin family protein [Candidatus Binatia bacterium]|nr:phage holin family protein [Candidatus Binatia bacterium]